MDKNVHTSSNGLRDLKTGDKFSVSFNNLCKVNFEELLVMLPKIFDKDIDESFKTFRYRKTNNSDGISSNKDEQTENSFDGIDLKRTCSGHAYSISINSLRLKFPDEIELCTVRVSIRDKIICSRNKKGSILKKKTFKHPEFGYPKIPEIVPYFDMDE